MTPLHNIGGGYVEFQNKLFKKEALKDLRPDLFKLVPDSGYQSNTNFGTKFPKIATKGDIFVRVDVMPNRVFKFDGKKWIERNKEQTQSYLDDNYLDYLIKQVQSGQYDYELLTEDEKSEIERRNNNQNT